MQINIKQEELEIAVRDYILKAGITRSVGTISFTATRTGGSGTTAEIEITDAPVAQSALSGVKIREMQTFNTTTALLSEPASETETPDSALTEFASDADVDSSASLFS